MREILCPFCHSKGIRIDKFDAYACRHCVIWLEKKCEDPDCYFCPKRPETPENVDWDDFWNT